MEFTRALCQPNTKSTGFGFTNALAPKRLNMVTVKAMRDAPKEIKKQLGITDEETAVKPVEKTTKKKAVEPVEKATKKKAVEPIEKKGAVDVVTKESPDPVVEKILQQSPVEEADYKATTESLPKNGDSKNFMNRIDWDSQYVEDNIGEFIVISELRRLGVFRCISDESDQMDFTSESSPPDAPKEIKEQLEMINETAVAPPPKETAKKDAVEPDEKKAKALEVVTEVSLDPVAAKILHPSPVEETDYVATAELFSKSGDDKNFGAKDVFSSITAVANEKLKAEKVANAGKKKTGAKNRHLNVEKADDDAV